MDSQQVFLEPQLPPIPSSNSTLPHHHHQPQKCTTQLRQQPLQQPQCGICGTTQKLLRCAKCKAIYYCSTNHQHEDWPTHKQECRQLAKNRQINNRLTQLTNGCGAMNINSPTNSANTHLTSSSSSLAVSTNNLSATQVAHPHQQSLDNLNIPNPDGQFILGTHEHEILNSKAESVTQNSNRSEYVGNFDANSTTSDQMYIMGRNDLNLLDMIDNSNQLLMDNTYLYQTLPQQQPEQDEEQKQDSHNKAATLYGDAAVEHLPQQLQNAAQQPLQQQIYLPQDQQISQQNIHYPVPQFSNHVINQHEKSSSYQIGTAAFDESVFDNANELRYEELCRNIINDMNQYGLSVVDDFLGRENGLQILNEVHKMYSAGVFKDGQLVNNMKSEQDLRTIRGDKITWVKGVEPGCSNVGYLINQIDAVICRANSMLDNGKLGNYVIKERTKAMVACYPGSGSHYVMHVDNPNKDGRVITAIYYLNLNWDSRDSGGVLRIFPEQTKSVADIEPKFDRLIFFWSDKRNPHEVQPAHRTRYAITVWYFDANEREQALNRCKNKQNSNHTSNNASSSTTNATTTNSNQKIIDLTTSSTDTDTSKSSETLCSSSSLSTPQLSLTIDNSEESTTNLTATDTNSPKPIQIVRPTYVHK